MMENLRRFVWKVESLSGITNGVTKEKQLPAIPDEHDVSSHHSTTTKGITKEKPLPEIPEEHDVSSHHSTEPNQLQSDQNNFCRINYSIS
jgi:hypothetical protein